MIKQHCPSAIAGRSILAAVHAATLVTVFSFAPFSFSGGALAQTEAVLQSVTRPEIRRLETAGAQRTEAQTKMSSQLIDAARLQASGAVMSGMPTLRSAPLQTKGGKTLVDIDAEVDDALLAAITRAGGTVVRSSREYRAVRAYVPVDRMESLAANRKVKFITPASKAEIQATPVAQEGVIAHSADTARELFHVDGSGIKIGILSDSIDNGKNALEQAYQTGAIDRKHLQILPDQAGNGDGEGLAMAEIVHAVAPGATIYFATGTGVGGALQMADNIKALQEAGCTIIIDDLTYDYEPPFEDWGSISRAVSYVTSKGVLYFSSAGNSGNKRQNTSSVWEGNFVDGGPVSNDVPDEHFHLFAPGQRANVVLGGPRNAQSTHTALFWADPVNGSTNQYNLFVVDRDGHITQKADTSHTGQQPPWQMLDAAKAGEVIVITKAVDAKPLYLRLETPRAALTISTPGNTRGHGANDNSRVFSVAAIDVDPPEPFTVGFAKSVAPYSSDGPRHKFFNPDDTPITPGNQSATGGRRSLKPDIAAAASVNTSVPGFRPFDGTSAASPHAGAVAALLWSYDRSLTADQVGDILRRTAVPIGGGPGDDTAGAGAVTAVAALRRACQQGGRLVCPDGSEAVVTSKPPLTPPNTGTDAETATQMLLK